MKKAIIVYLILFMFISPVFSGDGENQEEDALDVEIEGLILDTVDVDKLDTEIEVDYKEIVPPKTGKSEDIIEEWDADISDRDYEKFAEIASRNTVNPTIPDIPEPPLIDFYPEFADTEFNKWKIEVVDDRGRVIKTIEGAGKPRTNIEWDGIDDSGEMIRAGRNYSYRFIGVDRQDKVHRVESRSFKLNSLKYTSRGELIIEIWNSHLYENRAEDISDDAITDLNRVVNILQMHSSRPHKVEIYSNASAGGNKVNLIKEFLAENLPLIEAEINVELKSEEERGKITAVKIDL